jgi:hypothetical protein
LHYAAGGGKQECCEVNQCHKAASPFWQEARFRLSVIAIEWRINLFWYLMMLFLQLLISKGASRLTLNCNG